MMRNRKYCTGLECRTVVAGRSGSGFLLSMVLFCFVAGSISTGMAQTTTTEMIGGVPGVSFVKHSDGLSSTGLHHTKGRNSGGYDIERMVGFLKTETKRDESFVNVKTLRGTTPGKFGCDFDGRVAPVKVKNNSRYPVNVYLVHPDSGTRWPGKDSYWTVEGGKSVFLRTNGDSLGFGSDWKIQIGGAEPRCIGSVCDWDSENDIFVVSTDNFFKE